MPHIKPIFLSLKTLLFKTGSYILVSVFLILVTFSSFITVINELGDTGTGNSSCNTALIKINGEIVEYKSGPSDEWTDEVAFGDIITYLENAESDSDIKAIIVEINSGGGSTVGGQRIANALKRATKPTVALVDESANSSAYWIASGADRIFASNLSDVGSIGIIWSQNNQVEKDKKDGYEFNILTSGKYKSIGDAQVPLSQNDKNMLMKDIMKMHEIFVNEIATNRNIDRDIVAKLADGSSMLGEDALEAGLIDEIGDLFTVKNYLANWIGEDVRVCED